MTTEVDLFFENECKKIDLEDPEWFRFYKEYKAEFMKMKRCGRIKTRLCLLKI